METLLKQLIKEAVLEALMDFANGGIAVASEAADAPEKNESGKDESGKGGASGETSGGGTGPGGKPKPDAGVGVFGLR